MSLPFSRAFLACLLISLAASVSAGPPAGGYAFSIGGDAEIWQPGGLSESCEPSGNDGACFSVDSSTGIAGNVVAAGVITIFGELEGEIDLLLAGKVSGSTQKTKVTLTGSAEGSLTDGFVGLDVTGSATFKCQEDPSDRTRFQCQPTTRLCFLVGGAKIKCANIKGRSGEASIAAIGGAWQLGLMLATDSAGRVTGSAQVELATGQILDFAATGRYSAKSDTASLDLRGVGEAIASRIKLSQLALAGGTASAGKVSLTLAGQKGMAVILPAP